eukprot:scaffold29884_cov40-Prasinocladus_malaysianus.AAC.2
MARSNPSAVDNAAASPPADISPAMMYGWPEISGAASTTTSLTADGHETDVTVYVHPVGQGGQGGPDNVLEHLELGEAGVGRGGHVQQKDEKERPGHRPASLADARSGEVAHQDVREGGGADHQAYGQRPEVELVADVQIVRNYARRAVQILDDLLLLGDGLQDVAVGEPGDGGLEVLDRHPDAWDEVGDDENNVLCHLCPSDGPHASEQRTEQNACEADEDRCGELKPEEAAHDDSDRVSLGSEVGERGEDKHDDGQQAGDVAQVDLAAKDGHNACVTVGEEIGDSVTPKLAQVRGDQDRDEAEATGPADNKAQALVASSVDLPCHPNKAGARHPVGGGGHAVEDSGHAVTCDVVILGVTRA